MTRHRSDQRFDFLANPWAFVRAWRFVSRRSKCAGLDGSSLLNRLGFAAIPRLAMADPTSNRHRLVLLISIASASVISALAQSPSVQLPVQSVRTMTLPLVSSVIPNDFNTEKSAAPKRLFGVVPNFRADQYQETYAPLTTAQKFEIGRHDSFDWPNYFLLLGYAAQSQITSTAGKQKSIATGFLGSYSRSVVDQIAGSYITEAILPSLLHEDPRFFRLGSGTFWRRTSNAVCAVVISRRDNGTRGSVYSEILGNAGVVALSNLYYADDRSAPKSLERYGLAIGNDMVSNLLTEFWPDIRRRFTNPRH
jgi:hypothetical protein